MDKASNAFGFMRTKCACLSAFPYYVPAFAKRCLSTHSYEEGNITTLHIKLGSIYSEDFDLNVKLFMNS